MPKETKDIEEGPISTELDGTMLPTNPMRRIAIVGAGSADCGIANLLLRAMFDAGLPEAEARRFYAVDRDGLLLESMPGVLDFQQPFVQSAASVTTWSRDIPIGS
jgi:malate dehydrogenase (oxaloacetate-decarboxylating)